MEEIKTMLENINKRLEKLEAKQESSTSNNSLKEYVKKEGDGKVMMDKYKKGILVTGDTFPIKNTLSENGGKWNKALGGWMFTNSHIGEVIEAIREDGIFLTVADDIDFKDK